MTETCRSCGEPRKPGLRCPHCGIRYEDPIPDTVEAIIAKWDDQTMMEDLMRSMQS